MCGRATLAMEESSTTMKVASITLTATIHGFTEGRHSACAALLARAGLLVVLKIQFTKMAGSERAMAEQRKLRIGMVGGGPGAFIGPVHKAPILLELMARLKPCPYCKAFPRLFSPRAWRLIQSRM